MSLRSRIALLVGVTVLLASAIGGVGTTISSRSVGRDRVDSALINDVETFRIESPRLATQLQFAFDARRATCNTADEAEVDAEIEAEPDRRGQSRLPAEFASNMQLLRPNGMVFATCQTLPISAEETTIATTGDGRNFRTVSIEGERFRVLTRGFGDIGAVQFARSLELTEDTRRSLVVRSLIFGLLGAIFAGAVGWLFAKQATDPVKRLSEAAEHVARTQDLGQRITVDGDDEIGALASSFNTMLLSLDTSREQQKRLVQDASHELRTPLTSMRTNVELLQRHAEINSEVRTQILDDIGAELNELTQLTIELVDSATEVPTTLQLRDEIDLAELVNSCVERARRRHHRTITVRTTTGRGGIVHGDSALLSRAVNNLVNNAVKFSDHDTEIDIEVSIGELTVSDRGPGIHPDDLPFIFNRFYRATTARSAPGSGLGLAIVKQIVSGHGGTLSAANRLDGGAQIRFSLPVVTTTQFG
jgi:two-component system sensor histidine kinase MprB